MEPSWVLNNGSLSSKDATVRLALLPSQLYGISDENLIAFPVLNFVQGMQRFYGFIKTMSSGFLSLESFVDLFSSSSTQDLDPIPAKVMSCDNPLVCLDVDL